MAGLTTITVAERPSLQAEPVFDGPSVLLSYVDHASPYTGVGRYEGRATCTAFLLDTGALARRAPEAPGYAVTSGHCPAAPGPNDVVIDGAGVGQVVFNLFIDSQRWQLHGAGPADGVCHRQGAQTLPCSSWRCRRRIWRVN